MKLYDKKLIFFLIVAWISYLAGGWMLDYLIPIFPTLFSGLMGEVLQFSIPTAVFYFAWKKYKR